MKKILKKIICPRATSQLHSISINMVWRAHSTPYNYYFLLTGNNWKSQQFFSSLCSTVSRIPFVLPTANPCDYMHSQMYVHVYYITLLAVHPNFISSHHLVKIAFHCPEFWVSGYMRYESLTMTPATITHSALLTTSP